MKMFIVFDDDTDPKARDIYRYMTRFFNADAKKEVLQGMPGYTFDFDPDKKPCKVGRNRKFSYEEELRIVEETRKSSFYRVAKEWNTSASTVRNICDRHTQD